jgi:hypothetical protein
MAEFQLKSLKYDVTEVREMELEPKFGQAGLFKKNGTSGPNPSYLMVRPLVLRAIGLFETVKHVRKKFISGRKKSPNFKIWPNLGVLRYVPYYSIMLSCSCEYMFYCAYQQ